MIDLKEEKNDRPDIWICQATIIIITIIIIIIIVLYQYYYFNISTYYELVSVRTETTMDK